MKNKTTNKSTTSNITTNTPKYKTTNGIQKLPSGNYRVRKTINGQKIDGTFKLRKDAKRYLTMVTSSTTK